jgi:hypothetical protein
MTVTPEHVTRSVDGIPAIRDVSLTLERGNRHHLEPRTSMLTSRLKIWRNGIASLFLHLVFAGGSCFAVPWL